MVTKVNLADIINFIEKKKKHVESTSEEWGYDCLALPDLYELLNLIGVDVKRGPNKNGKEIN